MLEDDYPTARPRRLVADSKYTGPGGTDRRPQLPAVSAGHLYQVITAAAARDADIAVIVQPLPEALPINKVGLEVYRIPSTGTAFGRDLTVGIVRLDMRLTDARGPLHALANQLETALAPYLDV